MPEQTQLDRIEARQARIEQQIDTLTGLILATLSLELRMGNTFQTLIDKVTQETSQEEALIALLTGVSAQLKGLQPTQEAIDTLASQLDSNISKMVTAVQANTQSPPSG